MNGNTNQEDTMRYVIMDSMLDWSSVFLIGLIGTWIMHSCFVVAGAWWRESKTDMKVELVEHDDPQLQDMKEWRNP
jgi:hypothetical protein